MAESHMAESHMAESRGEAKGATAHTEAGGGKPPFPPFEKNTFASQLVSLVIAFVVLYLVVSRIALPRVSVESAGATLAAGAACTPGGAGAAGAPLEAGASAGFGLSVPP